MPLGLGTGLSKSGIVTPGIVTDNLVLKHMLEQRILQVSGQILFPMEVALEI